MIFIMKAKEISFHHSRRAKRKIEIVDLNEIKKWDKMGKFSIKNSKKNMQLLVNKIASGKVNISPLEYLIACYCGNVKAIDIFLEEKKMNDNLTNNSKNYLGKIIDFVDEKGNNGYMLACMNGKLETMKHLEKKGIKSDTINSKGTTPYLMAVSHGHLDIMEYMEKKGFNINAKDDAKCDAFLNASVNDRVEIMEYLVKKGFDPHVRTKEKGYNAFHLATLYGNTRSMSYLEKIGVDIHATLENGKNNNYVDAFTLAICHNEKGAMRFLKNKGFDKGKYVCRPGHNWTRS